MATPSPLFLVESTYPGNLVVGPPDYAKVAFGVPPGGPWDPIGAALAKALIGSPPDEPCLEIASELKLRCLTQTTFSLVSAQDQLSMTLKEGEALTIRQPGLTSLALPGLSSPLGPLAPGQVLSGTPRVTRERRLAATPPHFSPGPIRLLGLPGFPRLDGEWEISRFLSRIGTKLVGNTDPQNGLAQSEPSVRGAIQVSPGGEVMIHGPDGPTLGGYVKVAAIPSFDWGVFAQLGQGSTATFQTVEWDVAQEIGREHREALAKQVELLRNTAL